MFKAFKCGILIFLIIGFGSISIAQQEAVLVKVTKVQMVELYDVFSVIGQCKSDMGRDYYANVAGTLDEVSAKQGSKVHKGDVLLVIDKDIAIALKSQAIADLKAAEASYGRSKALFAKQYIGNKDLEKSSADLEKVRFDFAKSMNNYDNMFIIAPFDGEIGVIKPRIGSVIQKGDYLFSITSQDASTRSILVELPESLHDQVTPLTELIVTDNKGGAVKGHIASISQYVSDNGTISARITINSNNNIFLGSYVNVDVIINKHKNLCVPDQVIQSSNKGHFIYKIDDNKASKIYVNTGTTLNNLTEIISDEIKEGDNVVLEGITKIGDGSLVKILE